MSKINKNVTIHYGGLQNVSVVFENVTMRAVETAVVSEIEKVEPIMEISEIQEKEKEECEEEE